MTMPTISDHAVLRYLERGYGLDVEAMKRKMQTPALEVAHDFGADTLITSNGARLIIHGDTVVTVHAKRLGRRPRG